MSKAEATHLNESSADESSLLRGDVGVLQEKSKSDLVVPSTSRRQPCLERRGIRRPLRGTIMYGRESIFRSGCARDRPVLACTSHTHLVTRKTKTSFSLGRAMTTDEFREHEEAEEEEDGHDAGSNCLDAWLGCVEETDWGEAGSACAGPVRVAVNGVVLRRRIVTGEPGKR